MDLFLLISLYALIALMSKSEEACDLSCGSNLRAFPGNQVSSLQKSDKT